MTAMTADTPADNEPDETSDAEEILAEPVGTIEIDGVTCKVGRIKTRELFVLLRILTAGGRTSALITEAFGGAADAKPEEIGQKLATALLVSIPHAESDFLGLMRDLVVLPAGLDAKKGMDVHRELQNPDLDVALTMLQIVISQEAGELARLGKAAKQWWTLQGPKIAARRGSG